VLAVCTNPAGEMGFLLMSEDRPGIDDAIAHLERAIRWLRERRLLT
jgi:hypothetical protein